MEVRAVRAFGIGRCVGMFKLPEAIPR